MFTVLIPTEDQGASIDFALRSLQRQTRTDWEGYILGNGVPEAMKGRILQWTAQEPRLRFVDFPKHPQAGEPYRHHVLSQLARGDEVAYLSAGDIWFSDHLEHLGRGLAEAEFVHASSIEIGVGDQIRMRPADLSMTIYRQLAMVTQESYVPLSAVGHRMEAYGRRIDGWTPTPDGGDADRHFVRKFLGNGRVSARSLATPTVFCFPQAERRVLSEDDRVSELSAWEARVLAPEGETVVRADLIPLLVQAYRLEIDGVVRMSRSARPTQVGFKRTSQGYSMNQMSVRLTQD